MIHRLFPLVAIPAALIAGCTVGPDYHPPQMPMPEAFSSQSPTTRPAATQPTTAPTTQPAAESRWWTSFHDPVLDDLIARATEGSPDLRLAAARVREARALRAISRAGAFPTVNGSASYNRTRISENSSAASVFSQAFAGGGSAGGGAGGSGGIGGMGGFGFDQDLDLYQVGFDASWELDLFGGVRRAVEAADASIAAASEGYHDVLTSLRAEIARNYLDLRGFQRELEIAHRNLRSQRETIKLTEARFRAGLTSELDVHRAVAQTATTESQIPVLQVAAQRAAHQLSVLLGQPPATLKEALLRSAPAPASPGMIPPGLPSELLRRRPDIRQAEAQLHAATANIGVAKADLFPRFALTGNAGLQSQDASDLLEWNSRFWSFGPRLSVPIFNAGRIRSNIAVQDARAAAALANYERVVLNALRDVENALAAHAADEARQRSLAEAVAANRRAVALANELYTRGLVDFLSVLEAQRSLFLTEQQHAESERAVASDIVGLFKALGGGWEDAPPAK